MGLHPGLLSKGNLRLRFGGLIYERAHFWEGLLSEFYDIYKKGKDYSIGSTDLNIGELHTATSFVD